MGKIVLFLSRFLFVFILFFFFIYTSKVYFNDDFYILLDRLFLSHCASEM